ncbi:unnamed protein product, partial [Mesorhabditis belari]|uniref:RRM domain-containing protein n=1 Tax=Mesorhabditis belari TaxID=2138241 RepID=A0AAF3FCB7_9BILA
MLADEYKNDPNVQENSEAFCKIFIGGIKLETTEETMREFYGKFGEITDCVIMKDPHTKRSRGFGFVTYKHKPMVDECMKNRPHEIDGKTVDPKRAVPKDASNKNESNISSKRLYVSGVKDSHTEDMFRDYFTTYGNVEKVEIIVDKSTGKPRGFAFVSFDDYDPVDQCILEKSHTIEGSRCDVKKALSKDEMAKAQNQRDRQQRFHQTRGPGGRGGGGYQGGGWNQGGGGGYGGGYDQGYGGWNGGQQQGWAADAGAGWGQQGGWGAGQQGGWAGQQGGQQQWGAGQGNGWGRGGHQ